MALTIEEQAKILRYLGYANWENLAQSFQLGFPALSQPEFLVRQAFLLISEESLNLVRQDLQQLECIEAQRIDARKRFKALKLGDLQINTEEIDLLEAEDKRWKNQLADDLGVYTNPFSRRNNALGGINARVVR